MSTLFLEALGPAAVGLVLAVAFWAPTRHSTSPAPATARVGAVVVSLGLVGVALVARLLAGPLALLLDLPVALNLWWSENRFAWPLWIGLVGVALVALPVRRRETGGSADLTPRSLLSFTRARWFLAPAIVLAAVLGLTVAAGAASRPDAETGRHMLYWVPLGPDGAMGTTIYGWYYSVPCLVLLATLIALVVTGLALIARPSLSSDRARDVADRTARSRDTIAVATGALALHLSAVLDSLAGTASMRGRFDTSEGSVSTWTTFAALGPTLSVAAFVAATVCFTAWFVVIASAVRDGRRPRRRAENVAVPAPRVDTGTA